MAKHSDPPPHRELSARPLAHGGRRWHSWHRTRDEYATLISTYSQAIKAARVLCIVAVAYVHVRLFDDATYLDGAYAAPVRSVLVDLWGRSSVPLLSVVSGLLMVGYFERRRWSQVAQSRAWVLIVPMVTWNLIFLALTHGDQPEQAMSSGALFDQVFALTGPAACIPLTFLRDLFVVSLATPLLVRAARAAGPTLLVCTVALASQVDSLPPILLRTQILLYFVVGIYVAVYRTERLLPLPRRVGRSLVWLAMAALVGLYLARPLVPDALPFLRDQRFETFVQRPICATGFWLLSVQLGRSERLGSFLGAHIEPAIFTLFLSHVPVMLLVGSVYHRFGVHTPAVYFAVWLAVPWVCLLTALLFERALPLLPGPVSIALAGKNKAARPSARVQPGLRRSSQF